MSNKLSLTDKLYCWFKGINPNDVTRIDNYYGNKVIWTKSDDEEFIKRTNKAFDKVMENNDKNKYYSVDEFLEELKKW